MRSHERQVAELDLSPDKSEVQFINRIVMFILSTGMYATVAFYLIGLFLLFTKGDPVPEISKQYFNSFGSFVSGIYSFNPRPFFYLGTISLILTPVSRVLISIFAFWKENDRKFVYVTAMVFLIILASIVVGSIFKINVG
ncbi:MAG TPA: DUF1634 domain-containing protein [Candidatus Acidoferrales bacterium]|nr:DUF1634 domain-containing protein [Candidatus Acidoferrales bacterium]